VTQRLRTFVAIPLNDALRQTLAARSNELVDPPPSPPPLRGGGARSARESRTRFSPPHREARGRLGGGSTSSEAKIAVERLHLTLQFLGATLPAQLPPIGAALATIATGTAPFDLTLGGIGAFPDERTPNTLWLGVTSDVSPIAELATRVGQALAPLGFTPSARPFQPHVTLLRSKTPALGRRLLAELRRALPDEIGSMRAETIVFYRSETLPEGPRYTEIATARLGLPASPDDRG
jgi:2'-5' RNA ligase